MALHASGLHTILLTPALQSVKHGLRNGHMEVPAVAAPAGPAVRKAWTAQWPHWGPSGAVHRGSSHGNFPCKAQQQPSTERQQGKEAQGHAAQPTSV